MLYAAVADHECKAPQEGHAASFKRGQLHRIREAHMLIREENKR